MLVAKKQKALSGVQTLIFNVWNRRIPRKRKCENLTPFAWSEAQKTAVMYEFATFSIILSQNPHIKIKLHNPNVVGLSGMKTRALHSSKQMEAHQHN
jgi:hypothetical protein